MAVSRISLFALTGSLAALASVIQAGTVAPASSTADKCPAPAAPTEAATAQTSASPAPSGTLPAETATQPAAMLTVSGKDRLTAPVCPPPAPASNKITKSRSNNQNN